jgi:hypothetical protein
VLGKQSTSISEVSTLSEMSSHSPEADGFLRPDAYDREGVPDLVSTEDRSHPSRTSDHTQLLQPSVEQPTGLPPGKGFPIQIGSELFQLSGASIMSDGW